MNEDQLILYIQSIIEDIAASIQAKDLTKEEEVVKLKAEIQTYLRRFDVAVEDIVPEMIANEYFGSIDEATRLLVDEGVDVATGAALGADGVIAEQFRQPVYLDGLTPILESSFSDLRAARRTAEMSALTTVDDTIADVKGRIAKGQILGQPRKIIEQQVMEAFRKGGLTSFITEPDVNGVRRKLPLDFYAMTVTRTKMRDAGVTGAVTRYEEAGMDLVKIYERHDTCEICGRFRNMVVSLRGETPGFPVVGENGVRLPPMHANCRGSIVPVNLKRKTPEEIDEMKKRNAEYDPNKDARTERQRKGYASEQKKRIAANAEKKQFIAWNETLGADNYKTLGAFRRAKKANTPKFQELQSNYRSARMRNRVINPKTPPVREAAAEVTTVRGITENAKKRFKEITDVKKPLDFSTNAKRRAYAKDVLEKSGLGDIKLSVKKIKANGQVNYFKQKTSSGGIRADVTDFSLLSEDGRNDDYKKKTFFHELYHANYNGLEFDNDSIMTWKTRTSWEETATESAAHYMSKEVGVTGMIVPSYMKDLMNNLPRLKKLDEFKGCVTIEDFGEVFMKYRFDDDYKTGKWEWLNKSVAESSEAVAHEVFSYNAQHYHKYIEDNFDEAVREAAASMKEFHRENKRYHKIIREHFDKSIKTKSNSVGYDTLIGWAMKKLGVK